MSKKIIALVLALFITSNFAAPKAHAVIGLIAKSKTTKIVGGIGLGAGATTVGSVFLFAATTASSSLGTAIGAVLIAYLGIFVGGLGLIVLDEKTIADVEFMPIAESKSDKFSAYDVAVYNSELEELNAVRKTIQAESSEKTTVQEVNKLWIEYREALSPETISVAEAVSAEFTKQLK